MNGDGRIRMCSLLRDADPPRCWRLIRILFSPTSANSINVLDLCDAKASNARATIEPGWIFAAHRPGPKYVRPTFAHRPLRAPPQMPSIPISTNMKKMLRPSDSGGKKSKADSNTRRKRMTPCVIVGRDDRRVGSAGNPKEIEEWERKTVAW